MSPSAGARGEPEMLERLQAETGLDRRDAELYLRLLRQGQLAASESKPASRLLELGLAILSGDGRRIIPVHPRLGIANQYRMWRERVVKEVNDRRLRVDRLILELIPLYEAAREKKTEGEGV
jgi:hypothetical protein